MKYLSQNNFVGLVYADIELINATDFVNAKRSIIDKEEMKRRRITILVASGTYMMTIDDTIQAQLDLPFIEKRKAQMASGDVVEYEVMRPLMIKFANRTATCSAFVLPGDSEPLSGAVPMEEMDVLIHPQRRELTVNPEHTNHAQLKMKQGFVHNRPSRTFHSLLMELSYDTQLHDCTQSADKPINNLSAKACQPIRHNSPGQMSIFGQSGSALPRTTWTASIESPCRLCMKCFLAEATNVPADIFHKDRAASPSFRRLHNQSAGRVALP